MRRASRIAVLLVAGAALLLVALRVSHSAPASAPREAVHTSATKQVALIAMPPPLVAGVSGRVTTSAGALPGVARVCATCVSCEVTGSSDQVCTDTIEGGRYLLSGLGTSGYRITAAANGFAIGVADAGRVVYLRPGSARRDLDIVLDHEGEGVSGSVTDALGGPVPDANVRVVHWGAQAIATEVHAGTDGSFRAYTSAGRITLTATAPGYASARVYRFAPSSNIAIVLTPGASISGTVVTVGDGRPVAGVTVSAAARDASAAAALQTVSAADGSFEIQGLEPARYALGASGPGLSGKSDRWTEVGLAEQVKGVQLLVARAIQVDGKVLLSGSEAPCEEGMVMLGPPHPSIGLRPGSKWTYASAQAAVQAPALVTAPIGANGAVHFDAVPEGSYFATVQCQGAIQSEGPETLSVESRDITGLVWRVKPSTSLLLHVVDERRKPVAGAQVMLSWPEREGMRGAVTGLQTDGAGRVPAVPQLYPGVYVARASGGYDSDPLSIDVREGMTKIEATLELKGSATIELEVRDSEGAPVDGLDVSARRCAPAPNDVAQALVSAQLGAGHYRIAPLSPGCYGVAISDGVNPPTDVSMPAGNSRVELAAGQLVSARAVLDRTASVRGRVIDGAGHPLADVWVGATSGAEGADASQLMLQRRSMLATGRVLSDGEGRFTLTGLVPKATYDVRAEQPDGAIKIERNVPADQSLTITMPNTGAIGGVVTDARGRPLADFTLRVLEASTQSASTREFSGANGRFELDGITPGQLQIEAVEPSGQVAQAQAELKPGQTLDGLRLSLPD